MNIVTLTYVKNEADIIESLCRYTCAYADHMIIYDSESQDDSRKIIEKLIQEGLPITVFENKALGNPSRPVALSLLTELIFTSLKADWLVPVDADEFIGHVENISPRKTLEVLNPLIENHIVWRSYICDKALHDNSIFLPYYFAIYREVPNEFAKVLLSKELYAMYGCTHAFSFNELSYPNLATSPTPCEQVKDLFYAHYPLRSEQQTLIKVFLNCTDYELPPYRKTYTPSQYCDIYEYIIRTGRISMSVLRDASLTYGLEIPPADITVIEEIFHPNFCTDKLTLRYTQYENDIEKTIGMLSVQALEVVKDYGPELKKAFDVLSKEI